MIQGALNVKTPQKDSKDVKYDKPMAAGVPFSFTSGEVSAMAFQLASWTRANSDRIHWSIL